MAEDIKRPPALGSTEQFQASNGISLFSTAGGRQLKVSEQSLKQAQSFCEFPVF
jgi:hypothetical protein